MSRRTISAGISPAGSYLGVWWWHSCGHGKLSLNLLGVVMLAMSLEKVAHLTRAITVAMAKENSLHVRLQGLLEAVAQAYPDTWGLVGLCPRGEPPIHLADSFPRQQAKSGMTRFFKDIHRINPAWNAMQSGIAGGVYLMADLVKEYSVSWEATDEVIPSEVEETGYRLIGWPEHLVEVLIVTGLPDGTHAWISLWRSVFKGGISTEMIETLNAYKSLLDVVMVDVWRERAAYSQKADSPRQEIKEGQVFEEPGFPQLENLTAREVEIIRMALRGHSNLSISMSLGLAVPTVKAHRQKAYAKLGISTQQELFSLALRRGDRSGLSINRSFDTFG